MKKFLSAALILMILLSVSVVTAAEEHTGTVMLYSSLKESQLAARKRSIPGQVSRHCHGLLPGGHRQDQDQDRHRTAGRPGRCRLLWVGDSSDYLTFKDQGILEAYVSPEAETIDAAFKDPDNLYVGARLVVMGMAYNTNKVKRRGCSGQVDRSA